MFPQYVEYRSRRELDLQADGCTLAEWKTPDCKAAFALHESGFPIFLPYDRLQRCDEYVDDDPYSVAENAHSEFQRRRVSLTCEGVQRALSETPGKLRVLDIGCGEGHITDAIRMLSERVAVCGIDYSITAIESAHRTYSEVKFAVGDAYQLPYAALQFDLVVCNNIWEHVPDPLALLDSISSVLTPNGFVLISTPSRYRAENVLRILRGRKVAFMSPYHVTEYSIGQVQEQLAYGGFETLDVYSRPIARSSVKLRVARLILDVIFGFFKGNATLESTAFFLARRRVP